eukprot:UN05834
MSTIEECKQLCDETTNCVAFMFGDNFNATEKICELENTTVTNNSWGTNIRFCKRECSLYDSESVSACTICNDSNCTSGTCESGYHTFDSVTGICTANSCTCSNGTPATGAACEIIGREDCESCMSGYWT